MTECRAREILGVTATSTRRQIKAAYRQMVSSWHPDRLECRTEEVRQFATAKMVAINAAYRLLRSAPPQK
jgi:DnaJ-class molecular chaperone